MKSLRFSFILGILVLFFSLSLLAESDGALDYLEGTYKGKVKKLFGMGNECSLKLNLAPSNLRFNYKGDSNRIGSIYFYENELNRQWFANKNPITFEKGADFYNYHVKLYFDEYKNIHKMSVGYMTIVKPFYTYKTCVFDSFEAEEDK